MAFDLGDKIDILEHTDRPAMALKLILPVFKALNVKCAQRGSIKIKARAGLSVCVLSNVDIIE